MNWGEHHSAPTHCCHTMKECELTLADLQFFTGSCEPSSSFLKNKYLLVNQFLNFCNSFSFFFLNVYLKKKTASMNLYGYLHCPAVVQHTGAHACLPFSHF